MNYLTRRRDYGVACRALVAALLLSASSCRSREYFLQINNVAASKAELRTEEGATVSFKESVPIVPLGSEYPLPTWCANTAFLLPGGETAPSALTESLSPLRELSRSAPKTAVTLQCHQKLPGLTRTVTIDAPAENFVALRQVDHYPQWTGTAVAVLGAIPAAVCGLVALTAHVGTDPNTPQSASADQQQQTALKCLYISLPFLVGGTALTILDPTVDRHTPIQEPASR